VGFLANPTRASFEAETKDALKAAQALGVQLIVLNATSEERNEVARPIAGGKVLRCEPRGFHNLLLVVAGIEQGVTKLGRGENCGIVALRYGCFRMHNGRELLAVTSSVHDPEQA
jgi:hypothetical protein